MTQKSIRPLAAGLAFLFAGGLSMGAVAAPSTPAASQPAAQVAPAAGTPMAAGEHAHSGKGAKRHGAHARKDALFIAGLGPIPKTQLDAMKLNAEQQKEVEAIKQAQRELHTTMRQAHQARSTLLSEQLTAGKLDPAALASASDKARQDSREPGQALQKRSLAFWDSLNESQRQQVTEFVKTREQKKAEHRKGRERAPRPDAAPAAN